MSPWPACAAFLSGDRAGGRSEEGRRVGIVVVQPESASDERAPRERPARRGHRCGEKRRRGKEPAHNIARVCGGGNDDVDEGVGRAGAEQE